MRFGSDCLAQPLRLHRTRNLVSAQGLGRDAHLARLAPFVPIPHIETILLDGWHHPQPQSLLEREYQDQAGSGCTVSNGTAAGTGNLSAHSFAATFSPI